MIRLTQSAKHQVSAPLLVRIGLIYFVCALLSAASDGQTSPLPTTAENSDDASLPEVQPALPSVSTTAFDPKVLDNAQKGDANLRLQLLETYEELSNWKMTQALAELILEKEGAENIPALKAVSHAYLRMKNGTAALRTSSYLIEVDYSPEAKALQAQALTLLGRHAESATSLSNLKSSHASGTMFPWQEELAFALFHAGRNKESKEALQEILDHKDYPSTVKTTAGKQLRLIQALEAQNLMNDGENAKAIAILEELKRSGGRVFEYQEDLGHAYQNVGKLKEARQTFEAIVQTEGYDNRAKSNARDQINLLDSLEAEQLKDQGDYERAISLLHKLKKRFRNAIFPFQDQLAYTLADAGEKEAAREAFKEIENNPAYPEDQRVKAREEIKGMEVEDLVVKGYAALEGRVNWRQARQINAILMGRHASHPDAIGFHASMLSLSGQCEKAIAILEQLRDAQFSDQQFPHAGMLAECYYQVGDFDKAKAAYREAFEMPAIEAREQLALRDSHQGFRRETRPTVETSVTTQSEESGDTLTSEVAARVPFGAGWAIGATASQINGDEDDRQEAYANVEKSWGPGYFAKLEAGANAGAAAYSATLGKRKRALGSTAWETSYHKNETVEDTAELSSGDGRQDRIALDLQHDVTPGLRLAAGGGYRTVESDDKSLGNGYELNFEAAYGWNMANSRQRSFEVAYVADVSSFDGDEANTVVASVDGDGEIIDSDYHRQGAEVRWFGNFGKIEPYTMAGGYYRVDEGSFEFEVGGGVDFDMNEDTTVYVRGHYSSSGEGQNTGSGIVKGQLGVEKTF